MKSRIIFTLAVAFALSVSFNSFGHSRNVSIVFPYSTVMSDNPDKAYEQYAALENALAKDDAVTAQKAATKLAVVLKDIPGSSDAAKAATAISKTKDITVQRKSFATLSTAITKLFRAHKPDNVMIYIHYCPMKKAYWLSDSKDIENPYYGKSMPSCGKTTGMIM